MRPVNKKTCLFDKQVDESFGLAQGINRLFGWALRGFPAGLYLLAVLRIVQSHAYQTVDTCFQSGVVHDEFRAVIGRGFVQILARRRGA